MTIEIHSPKLNVREKMLETIKKKATTLSRFGESISRVEIFLTEENSPARDNKTCKIRLSIFGDTLFVQKTADSFEKAAMSVIRVLKRRLTQKFKERNLPPDAMTSTVEV